MQQRLAGLTAQAQELEELLQRLDAPLPDEGASAGAAATRGPSRGKNTPPPLPGAAARRPPLAPEPGRRGQQGRKGKKAVQFEELDDGDLFAEDAGAGGGRGGATAGLVETERDRLIRLVRLDRLQLVWVLCCAGGCAGCCRVPPPAVPEHACCCAWLVAAPFAACSVVSSACWTRPDCYPPRWSLTLRRASSRPLIGWTASTAGSSGARGSSSRRSSSSSRRRGWSSSRGWSSTRACGGWARRCGRPRRRAPPPCSWTTQSCRALRGPPGGRVEVEIDA